MKTTATGPALYERAKKLIPGGSMLLSKRPEMFLPGRWPSYFSKAKGCRVWDLDGNEYLDMCIMGIGTNTLGYGHPAVDAAVSEVVACGNMSTLNCPEEVYLAEKLLAMHPWAAKARFARTGGEANAIAVRVGRAASGRDHVAVCGYHGWHDWYLAANLAGDGNLATHLLPGLSPAGVPQELRDTIHPFQYNDLETLARLIEDHSVGVIVMEVMRNIPPKDSFLEKVRALATAKGIVLVFDECTSGFRETFGGLHLKFGVNPDIAMFGKALGNGYAITAVIGTADVMDHAQDSFISSTFWTERIGSAAALATLRAMEAADSWTVITETGLRVIELWRACAARHGLELTTQGLPALASFTIPGPKFLAYKTLITQEMLKDGILASNIMYSCTEHTDASLDRYHTSLDRVFGLIAECEMGRRIEDLLEGPVCQSGFARLN